jgi:hypothetical protein
MKATEAKEIADKVATPTLMGVVYREIRKKANVGYYALAINNLECLNAFSLDGKLAVASKLKENGYKVMGTDSNMVVSWRE